MKTVIVTGASGMIGLELCKLLAAKGIHVTGLTRSIRNAEKLKRFGVIPVIADILDYNTIENGLTNNHKKIDTIFHLAGPNPEGIRLTKKKWARAHHQRLQGIKNIISIGKKFKIKALVHISGSAVYGYKCEGWVDENTKTKSTLLGRLALDPEIYLKKEIKAGFPAMILHPCWVYGNGSWFEKMILKQMKLPFFIQIGNGHQDMSLIHVKDTAEAIFISADKKHIGMEINLADDNPATMKDFMKFCQKISKKLFILKIPSWLIRLISGSDVVKFLSSSIKMKNGLMKKQLGIKLSYPDWKRGVEEFMKD